MKNIFFKLLGIIIVLLSLSKLGYGQDPLLIENFNYTAHNKLVGQSNWQQTGLETRLPIKVVDGSLIYENYPSSGLYNQVMIKCFGQDVNYPFVTTALTSGNIYCSFLIKVIESHHKGDYFIHFSDGGTNNFYSKLYIKKNTRNDFYFGLMRGNNGTVNYTTNTYKIDTTYLLVIKYTFTNGINDTSSLFINPKISLPEPIPNLINVTGTTENINNTGIKAICLRQGGLIRAPVLFLDGIRIATSWDDIPLPIKLEFFNSNIINDNNVQLTWKTSYKLNNSGFEIYRDNIKIGFVKGQNIPYTYKFLDNKLTSGEHYYKLRQIDYNGNYEDFVPNINPIIINTPKKNLLEQNYPNPFNSSTKIDFTLSKANNISLKIYDITGKEVCTLINNIYYKEGYYSINYNALNLSNGVYFYKLYSNDFNITKKMIIVK